MVDQTCVPEIAVPTLRVPRRGTAWVNRAVHDIALAELAMVPCVPGIHDLQQACSHPQRVARGEAVPGGTLWLVHAQRAPGAGGQRSDTARKARQARCGCVRRRSCKTEATRELADAAVRCIDSVQFGGRPRAHKCRRRRSTRQRKCRCAPKQGLRQLTARECCCRRQQSCTRGSRSNEARSGQQRLPKQGNHSRRLALHPPTGRAASRVRGGAALAACVCAREKRARGPATTRRSPGGRAQCTPRKCGLVGAAGPTGEQHCPHGRKQRVARRASQETIWNGGAYRRRLMRRGLCASRVSGDILGRRCVPPPSHETWVVRDARLRRHSGQRCVPPASHETWVVARPASAGWLLGRSRLRAGLQSGGRAVPRRTRVGRSEGPSPGGSRRGGPGPPERAGGRLGTRGVVRQLSSAYFRGMAPFRWANGAVAGRHLA